MGRVVHFEIQADDPVRAKQFYESVFGWRIEQESADYWKVSTNPVVDDTTDQTAALGPGQWGSIDGGLVARKGERTAHDNPVSAYVCTVQVDDVAAAAAKVIEHAGNIMVDKYRVAGLGEVCYAMDTEGNSFCILQADNK